MPNRKAFMLDCVCRFVVCCVFHVGKTCASPLQIEEAILSKLSQGRVALFDEEPCFINIKDISIMRKSGEQGFHRNVNTTVSAIFSPTCKQCSLLFLESLPQGLFVDTYQINMVALEDINAASVLSFEKIDVEKPEHLAPSHTVAVYTPAILSSSRGRVTFHIDLPIHLRYHMPSSEGGAQQAKILLPHPDVLAHCSGCPSDPCPNENSRLIRAPCTSANQSLCYWTPVPYSLDTSPLDFTVPVGQESLSVPVTVVTIAALLTGMAMLLLTMLGRDKDSVERKLR